MREFPTRPLGDLDLFAAGLPCPPFSIAGQQLGKDDERDLFPSALRLIEEWEPKAVLIENVRGFLSSGFQSYRRDLVLRLNRLGYEVNWRLYDAKDFGVPQTRSRVTIVAMKSNYFRNFSFPEPSQSVAPSVGQVLLDLMSTNGWPLAKAWAKQADKVAPTIVGGSKKHGGPDLGPTRARAAWKTMSVNGSSIADDAPMVDFDGLPRLTTRMVARLQGFPDSWVFSGKKTAAYRQIGNAFPPPVAAAVARSIRDALDQGRMAARHSDSFAAE